MVAGSGGRGPSMVRRGVAPFSEPLGRLVTTVVTDALLAPLGIDRVVYAVRSPAGRLMLPPLGDGGMGCTGGPISLGDLAMVVGRLRMAESGGPPRLDDSTVPPVLTYAIDAGSLGWLVAGALCRRIPPDDERRQAHAAVSSGLRSLVQEALGTGYGSLPQVSIRLSREGFLARLSDIEGGRVGAIEQRGSSAAEAVARAAASASPRDVVIRFAAQKAVGSAVVTLVVADVDGVGPVVGATGLTRPSIVAPALAVQRACDAADRVVAESTSDDAVEVIELLDEQFALG